ncbi:MAG: GGDEF domain-containing protein [Rhizobiaceae bacterium]|nr:GGDEF domain-containing protein [Rhizobiaceae bacterium]
MVDNFAFLLPIMMGTFCVVFLALARTSLKLPSALAWGVAFGSDAAAFSSGLLPVSAEWQAIVGDLLFFISFYAYGEGLLIRFQRPRLIVPRVAFICLCLIVDIYVVFWMDSLQTELLLVDLGLTALLFVSVVLVFTSPRNIVDWALVIIAALVVVDTLVRVVVFDIIYKGSDALADYNDSEYTFFMQISGGALGLCFALAALGSILMDLLARYRSAAEIDPLTGLLNRRGFEDALARLPGGHLSGVVLSCDIDHFKQVNDGYGHAAGDLVITELARQIAASVGNTAISARFGGEEFVAYVPSVDLKQGTLLAQTVCDNFGGLRWSELGIDNRITVSLGVAAVVPGDRTIHEAIARSDRSLYRAKSGGRNQVAVHSSETIAFGLKTSAA